VIHSPDIVVNIHSEDSKLENHSLVWNVGVLTCCRGILMM
jgi:hypothetical protein